MKSKSAQCIFFMINIALFLNSERLEKIPEIRQNLKESLLALLSHMGRMNIKCSSAHLSSVAVCMINHINGVGRPHPVNRGFLL